MTGESLGQRIARLRASAGWTQQELADRIAISRVAVSHLEMGISVPSERTVALLAGAFHLEPIELVEQTSYPAAKAERLPHVAARYTEVELQIALMRRDLAWGARLDRETKAGCVATQVRETWLCRLAALSTAVADPRERRLLADARAELTDQTRGAGMLHETRGRQAPRLASPDRSAAPGLVRCAQVPPGEDWPDCP